MKKEQNDLGNITISNRAIATIAHQAAIQTYGVVGLAAKSLVNGLTHRLVKDPTMGIDVHHDQSSDQLNIDIYIIVEYGTRLKSVADSVLNSVRFQVEKSLGLPVNEINVHIQGLRISEAD